MIVWVARGEAWDALARAFLERGHQALRVGPDDPAPGGPAQVVAGGPELVRWARGRPEAAGAWVLGAAPLEEGADDLLTLPAPAAVLRARVLAAEAARGEGQQSAVAHLSRRALQAGDTARFLVEVVELVANTLRLDGCRLLEDTPQGLWGRASTGFPPGAPEPLPGTPAACALAGREPVLVEDYAAEPRFPPPAGLPGAVSGLHLAVEGRDRPWGVLEAWATRPRRFSDDEVHFALSVAQVVALALEQQRAEEAGRRSEASFHALIDASPDATYVVVGGRLAYLNRAGAALLGYQRQELLGTDPLLLLHPEERERAIARMRAALDSGRPNPPATYRLAHRSGRLVLAETVSVRLLFDGQEAAVIINRDVTERQQLQEQLLLADRLASVGTLAAGVAHEINNPLAYLLSNLSYVEGQLAALRAGRGAPLAGELALLEEALRDARDGAERVRLIVRDLKAFARADAEQLGPVDVVESLEVAINLAGHELRHRAELRRELGPVPRVRANSARLGQVFVNLLVNAAQALPEGPGAQRITIRTRTDQAGRAVVEVADTGAGIPEELRSRIFDPFFTTKPVGVGTGLGLSICHGIVSALGGEIQVESQVGQGSTFRVLLPPTSALSEARPSPPPREAAPGRRGRLLVVDDEPLVGGAARRALSGGHEVQAVTSAAAALALVQAGERYDLILCDLLMPGMTGMDLHQALIRLAPEQAGRMVFMTGGAFTARAQEFLGQPGRTALEKPFDSAALLRLVRERVG